MSGDFADFIDGEQFDGCSQDDGSQADWSNRGREAFERGEAMPGMTVEETAMVFGGDEMPADDPFAE